MKSEFRLNSKMADKPSENRQDRKITDKSTVSDEIDNNTLDKPDDTEVINYLLVK